MTSKKNSHTIAELLNKKLKRRRENAALKRLVESWNS